MSMSSEQSSSLAPFHSALVATDATRAADGALRVAAGLAARDGTVITTVSTVEPAPYPQPVADLALAPTLLPPAEEEGQAARRHSVLVQHEQLGLPAPSDLVVVSSMPVSAILFQAAQRKADLVIMGLGRHATVDRLFGSETALRAVREAERPVLAVPGTMEGIPRHAVVGMDFDESGISAARIAARLVGPNGRLTLVHVDPLAEPLPAMLANLPPHALGRSNDAFARQLAQLDLPETLQVDTLSIAGVVGKELVTCAERIGADVVVVGRHERGLLERLMLGSATTHVVRTATCAVMVVPRET